MAKKLPIKNLRKFGKLCGGSLQSLISIFIFGFTAGVGFEEIVGIGSWHNYHAKTDIFNVCFTPPSGCAALIVQQIAMAQNTIYVQAFDFTSEHIANELIKAKKRGVKIYMLLDRVNKNNIHSKMPDFEKAGIEIIIDKVPGIAHNKIMIIDKRKVITGSFNFTKGADTRNAENLLLIDDPEVARLYLKNWYNRKMKNQES